MYLDEMRETMYLDEIYFLLSTDFMCASCPQMTHCNVVVDKMKVGVISGSGVNNKRNYIPLLIFFYLFF